VLRERDFNNSGNPDSLVPFALDGNGGDDLFLLEADIGGNLLRFADHVEFAPAPGGLTWGRWPNANGPLALMSAFTLGAANSGPLPGYGAWVVEKFPAGSLSIVTAPGADPDGDGLTNWVEFAFVHAPLIPDAPALRINKGADADGDFTIQYLARPATSGITYQVFVSANLTTWNDTGDTLQTLSEVPQSDGSILTTVRLLPAGGMPFHGTRFLRVEAHPL
jgi:hypothetical protein